MFLLSNPSVWFAIFEVMSVCVDHERSSATVAARYFAA